jgi:formylglycine-generating enzyme required for sulfatase activity
MFALVSLLVIFTLTASAIGAAAQAGTSNLASGTAEPLSPGAEVIVRLPFVIRNYPGSDPGQGGDRIFIPAGEFQMGCSEANNGGYACDWSETPLHTVYLDDYYIDKTEVTNAQYAACVAASACQTVTNDSSFTRPDYHGVPEYDGYPVVYVNWWRAEAYCAWAGGRLPSEAEWEKAARGKEGVQAFPWGDDSPTCALANFLDLLGTGAMCMGDTTPAGSYVSAASPYGVLGMADNVQEWVNDWYQMDYYSVSPYANPAGPASGDYKVVRGGDFELDGGYLRVAYRTYGLPT